MLVIHAILEIDMALGTIIGIAILVSAVMWANRKKHPPFCV